VGIDELPYEVGYQDSDFEALDDDWYEAWLVIRHEPKLVYSRIDQGVDYPQYKDNFEALDRRRNGEEIYQRGTLRIRNSEYMRG